ncbi:MAG TPA: helix-turn-helix transcriptional regulator [Blastocatellia bacterium]|nr:helix-turn-helix transcriptional regulator [Blastocatellia bacterium]
MNAAYYDPEKVTRLRKRAGLTKEKFAKALNVTEMTIYRVERGESCSPELLVKIAEFGNTNWKNLLKDQPRSERKIATA